VRGFIEGCLDRAAWTSPKQAAIRGLEAMNRWIHAAGRKDPDLEGMACTFTGLLCTGRQAHLVHVGDSRLYRLRGQRLELLTTDHMAGSRERLILTRAVGAEANVRMDHLALQNEPYDRYLFCTDGGHRALSQEALREMLGCRAAPEETARQIVDKAVAGRIGDNATALILDIVQVPAANFADVEAAFADERIGPPPATGVTIDGFHLDAVLSDGRYVRVLRATDQSTGRQVVLKFPRLLTGAEGSLRKAFVGETWIASRVRKRSLLFSERFPKKSAKLSLQTRGMANLIGKCSSLANMTVSCRFHWCPLALANRGAPSMSAQFDGTRVPMEEPSTTSGKDVMGPRGAP
jgi:Protein phosphatase 2C